MPVSLPRRALATIAILATAALILTLGLGAALRPAPAGATDVRSLLTTTAAFGQVDRLRVYSGPVRVSYLAPRRLATLGR